MAGNRKINTIMIIIKNILVEIFLKQKKSIIQSNLDCKNYIRIIKKIPIRTVVVLGAGGTFRKLMVLLLLGVLMSIIIEVVADSVLYHMESPKNIFMDY